ncbi:Hypothetical predicted protein [Mytilus galloprovincialis]|uniref:Uncharacterized protein n=1 Tax=Mytilus galloprovincialis TaxID=29158 RepID=A0A8B6FF98_MYTGA|nr:Hypothetical predicted protein [Mytilus galloprovincialis]
MASIMNIMTRNTGSQSNCTHPISSVDSGASNTLYDHMDQQGMNLEELEHLQCHSCCSAYAESITKLEQIVQDLQKKRNLYAEEAEKEEEMKEDFMREKCKLEKRSPGKDGQMLK